MNSYSAYLQGLRYSKSSIERYELRLKDYEHWCKKKRIDGRFIDYKTLMKYVKYLQAKGWKPTSVNNQIRGVKYYLDYLIDIDFRVDNPAENVNVKQSRTTLIANILPNEELEDLYYSYPIDNINDFYFMATAKRNKVITGLIVYQGLDSSTLAALQLEHIELYKGKIYVPSTRKSNSRTLTLQSWQVIELMEYINEYRPKIQTRIKLYNDSLFPLHSPFATILRSVSKKLKQINNKFINLQQLRASVITGWLNQYNIREVQQMAGHRYIGSTERYLQDNLESLQESINQYHPLS